MAIGSWRFLKATLLYTLILWTPLTLPVSPGGTRMPGQVMWGQEPICIPGQEAICIPGCTQSFVPPPQALALSSLHSCEGLALTEHSPWQPSDEVRAA